MAINWEARRRRIREWYLLVARCRDTLTAKNTPAMTEAQEIELLLAYHRELKDAGEARNALDYVYGRKGNPRTLTYIRGH